jgi:hypothetical protein
MEKGKVANAVTTLGEGTAGAAHARARFLSFVNRHWRSLTLRQACSLTEEHLERFDGERVRRTPGPVAAGFFPGDAGGKNTA